MGLFDSWFGGNSQATAPYTNGANWSPQGLNAPGAAATAAAAFQVPNYMRAGVPNAAGHDWMSGYGANVLPEFESPVLGGGPPAAGGNGLFGWLRNGENLSALAQGIGALSGAWMGRKQLGIARDNLNFQRDAFERNFANQTRSYNTSLEDRIRGRSADYAGKENDIQSYLDRHRLTGS